MDPNVGKNDHKISIEEMRVVRSIFSVANKKYRLK